MEEKKNSSSVFSLAVIVAALGYFVDIYDLVLFSMVRKSSLLELGFSGNEILANGETLIAWQMGGMLIGGILWGIMGDKKGRLSVLFGSILLYSLANIANGFVWDMNSYIIFRLLAGIGLAGELGAGITLVSESVPKEKRGIATMIVATIGVSGALLAGVISIFVYWRYCYFIGGALGFMLLLLRVSVFESGMFSHIQKKKDVSKGNFLSLFTNREKFFRFLNCVLIGSPTWFMVGILVIFSPEFAKLLGVSGPVEAIPAMMICYTGLVLGDFSSGLLSQILRSRKKVMYIFLSLVALSAIFYFNAKGVSPNVFYALCGMIGFSCGFWAIFVTIGAEQFGTNLRATVATTVPNFVRGMVPLWTFLVNWMTSLTGDKVSGAAIVCVFTLVVAFSSLFFLKETFGKDLEFVE